MRLEIIRHNGDLKREVWVFTLSIGCSSACIYFDSYAIQTKETTRHRKWITQTHWSRLMRRDSTIQNPPLPLDVEAEMRKHYQEYVMTLPIKR